MCRDIELAVAAASAAVDDAGLITKATNAEVEPTYAVERMGCHIGAGLIAADVAIDDVRLCCPEMKAAALAEYDIKDSFIVSEIGAEYSCRALCPEQSAALKC